MDPEPLQVDFKSAWKPERNSCSASSRVRSKRRELAYDHSFHWTTDQPRRWAAEGHGSAKSAQRNQVEEPGSGGDREPGHHCVLRPARIRMVARRHP